MRLDRLSIIFIVAFFFAKASIAGQQVGFVLDCIGDCFQESEEIKRSLSFDRPVYQNEVIYTGKNSFLWIALFDRSIVRVASNSKIFVKKSIFDNDRSYFVIELHIGHVFYYPFSSTINSFQPDSIVEVFPLKDWKANPVWDLYELSEKIDLVKIDEKEKSFLNYRYKKLMNIIKENSSWFPIKKNQVLIHSPNLIVEGGGLPIDFFYNPDGKTIVGSRTDISGHEYEKKDYVVTFKFKQFSEKKLQSGKWFELKENKKIETLKNNIHLLEYRLYLKSFPSLIISKEEGFKRHKGDIKKIFEKKSNIKKEREKIIEEIQRTPFNLKESLRSLKKKEKYLMGEYNNFVVKVNRDHKKKLKTPSLVEVFQTSDKAKRSWLLKKGLKEVRDANRKILSHLREPESKKK